MPRRIIFILIALVLSVGAFFLAQQWFRASPQVKVAGQTIVAPPPAVRVLVAKTVLPVGTMLTADAMRWQLWPGDDAPLDYIVDGRGPPVNLVGALVRTRLVAGEPITSGEVARVGDKSAMSAMLAPGTRAMTINVNPATGVGGFLTPGDRVDVLVSLAVPNKSGPGAPTRVSQTILTNLRVVGVDQALTDDRKPDTKANATPKTVSLEVTPKQAEILAVAIDLGVINLTLHSLGSPNELDRAGPVTQTSDTEATHGVYVHPAVADTRVSTTGVVIPHFERHVQVVRGDSATEVLIPNRLTREGAAQ
jgi:pilus assembly protein CpaB